MTVVSLLVFFLILTGIISLHEFGHFATAKKFGVYCKEFAIGMGPKLWSKKTAETEYSVRAFPMGGFVAMIGEDGVSTSFKPGDTVYITKNADDKIFRISRQFEENANEVVLEKIEKAEQPIVLTYLEAGERQVATCTNLITCVDAKEGEWDLVAENREFSYLAPLKKIVILTAGVFLNFVLGFVLIFGATWIGGVPVDPIIDRDLVEVSAEQQLYQGDRILSIDTVQASSIDTIKAYVQANPGKVVAITLERDGRQLTLERALLTNENETLTSSGIVSKTQGALGITYQRNHTAIGKIFTTALGSFFGFFEYVYFVLVGLFSGKIAITNLTGFIGIAQQTNAVMTVETASTTFLARIGEISANVLRFAAFLSVNLGVMNIMPFPALDGGRVVFAVYELITRRKPNPKFEVYLNALGFLLLIGLFIMITFLDIKRLLGFGA